MLKNLSGVMVKLALVTEVTWFWISSITNFVLLFASWCQSYIETI